MTLNLVLVQKSVVKFPSLLLPGSHDASLLVACTRERRGWNLSGAPGGVLGPSCTRSIISSEGGGQPAWIPASPWLHEVSVPLME